MTRPESQPRPPLALLADWIESELAWIAAPMGSVAECNARDTVEPLHTSLLSLDPAALRAQAEAEAGLPPLDREPSTWDHRRTYAPGEQVWVVRFNVWHPAVIVRTDFIDYIVRIPSLDQLITATSCMLRTRAALAQAGGESL